MILIHPFWQSCPTSLTGTTAFAGSTAASNDPRSPYYGFYDYGWSAWILTADELGGAKQISGIGITHSQYTLPYTYANQIVKMGHVVESQFPSATPAIDLSGLTVTDLKTVKSLHNFTLPSGSNNTVFKHTFDSNFCYNGTSNLIIVWENRSGDSNYVAVGTQVQVVGATQTAYRHQDVSFPTGNATGVRNNKPKTLIYS